MRLLNYIQGFRRGKEAHRLEKEAMKDPFLADAMDGYDSMKESQTKQIELLRRQITVRAARKRNHAIGWSVAACLIMGLGISTYFLFQKDNLPQDARVAMEQPREVPATPDVILPTEEEVALSPDTSVSTTPPVTSRPKSALALARPVATDINKVEVEASVSAVTETTGKREVHGKVTDKQGEPLVGAMVSVKGTNQGTVSDVDGRFTLKVDGGKELVVNYIGYESLTVPADSANNLLIAMNDDHQALDEVVVVGYSTEKKNNLVGSVSTVSRQKQEVSKPKPIVGWRAYRKYLKKELKRPTDGECAGVKGKVVLTFYLDRFGGPKDIKVKKSLCPSADEAAIYALKNGSDWTQSAEQIEITIKF